MNPALGALSLVEIARVAVELVCLDEALDRPVREIGVAVGHRMAAATTKRSLTVPQALDLLSDACRQADFVKCQQVVETNGERP